jgi:hypothetical protein
MADALIFEFGADITKFTGNIAQVIDGLKKFREQAKTASVSELPALNAKIAEYTDALKRLKALGTPTAEGFKKIEDSSKGARIALTNVSQVVQDLPFGFIGIQNNIPGVIQSFTKLRGESGGVIGALKAMGSALIGPAGIFLGFSLVTAGVTALISKYGSLGAGLEALFSNTNLATRAQLDYNKALAEAIGSSATEVAEIKILVGVLTDLSQPLKDRQAAYVELEKIRPDVIAGQKLENISTEEATRLIKENTTAVLNLILLKAKETAISNILNKNSEDLVKLQKEELSLKARIIKAQNFLNSSTKEGLAFTDNAAGLIKILTNDLKDNLAQQDALNKVANEYLAVLDPTIKGIAEIDRATKEKTDAEGKAAKAAAQAKKDAEDLAKWEKIRLANLALIEKFTGKKIYEPVGQIQLTRDNVDFGKLMTKDQPIELFDIKSFQEAYDRFIQKIQDTSAQLKLNIPIATNLTLPDPVKFSKMTQMWLKSGLSLEDFNKQIEDNFTKTYNFINNLLVSPLENLFTDILTKGENAFANFGKTIQEILTKLAVKLLAAAAIAGVIALLTGGSSAAGGVAGSSSAGNFGKIFSSLLGIGKASNPTFGGVQGGGMGMSGSVNLTLRGTDLVGAINRTNTQISRVG